MIIVIDTDENKRYLINKSDGVKRMNLMEVKGPGCSIAYRLKNLLPF